MRGRRSWAALLCEASCIPVERVEASPSSSPSARPGVRVRHPSVGFLGLFTASMDTFYPTPRLRLVDTG